MARIRAYNEQQVMPDQLRAPKQPTSATPESFGGLEASALAKTGAKLADVGEDLGRRYQRVQEERDAVDVLRHLGDFQDEERDYRTSMAQAQGANARGSVERTSKWYEDKMAAYSGHFTNERQRLLFESKVRILRDQSLDVAARHEADQDKAAKVDATKGVLEQGVKIATDQGMGDEAVNWAVSNFHKTLSAFFPDKDTTEAAIEGEAKIRGAYLDRLAVADVAKARAYLTAHRANLGTHGAEVERKIEAEEDKALRLSVAERYRRMSPEAAMASAEKEFAGRSDLYDTAISSAIHQFNIQESLRQKRESQMLDSARSSLDQAVAAQDVSAINRIVESLPEKHRGSARAYVNSQAAGGSSITFAEAYVDTSDQIEAGQPVDWMAVKPKLSIRDYQRLKRQEEQAQRQGHAFAFGPRFNSRAAEFGIKGDELKSLRVEFDRQAQERGVDSPKEQDALLEEFFVGTIMRKPTWFGLSSTETIIPSGMSERYLQNPDNAGYERAKIPGRDPSIDRSVTDQAWFEAAKWLESKKMPVTQANIRHRLQTSKGAK